MKAPKLVLAGIALFMSVAAFSQTDTTKTDTTTTQTDTSTQKKDSVNIQEAGTTATDVSQSATAQQTVPAANFGKYYIPVLGEYKSTETSAENQTVTISGDETNAGKVWVEGLNGVKFYALLKAVPGTYKIPAQKQDDKSIHEGSLTYDEATKQVSICLGCGYNNGSDAATTETKTGKKKNAKELVKFTGTKSDQTTAQK